MTQQWGIQGQQPGPGGQQWAGQPNWNRPPQAWGAPVAGGQPQFPPGQYPPAQYPPGQYPPGQYPPGQFPPAQYPPGQFPPAQYPPARVPYGPPQGQYGQPGGFPPANRPPQPGGPRRSSPFRGVLLGLVLVVGLGFFAISLLHYLGGDVTDPVSGPTPSQTTAPPVPVPDPDFSPGPVPAPETYEEATTLLRQNAVYDQTAPVPTDCQVPGIDLPQASVEELTTHLNDLTACLWRVWSPPLVAAGYEMPRPPVTIYNEPITTACGKQEDVNAFYCSGDQRIYYAKPLYKILPENQQTLPFVADTILAHEFGHAIQARTGILISSAAWEQKSSKAEGRVFSRRLEMQADCFAGIFTVAVAGASGLSADDLTNLQPVIFNIGDDVLTGKPNYDGDHGLGKNRQEWFKAGQGSPQIGKCNTYTVAAAAVR